MRSVVALVGVVVLGAAIAMPAFGQRGSGALTKAEVIAKGSKICRAAEAKVNRLPEVTSENPFAKTAPAGDAQRAIVFLAGFADALAGVRAGFAQLDAPAQGRSLLRGFIRDLGPTIATFRRAHNEALAHKYDAASAHAEKAFGLFEKASRQTRAYGFPKDVC
jgi:hypothetical protein